MTCEVMGRWRRVAKMRAVSAAPTRTRAPRLATRMRDKESVTPLELFFDLVFVLALTQCTQLMADEPTWNGLAKAMLVLAVLWWSWSGYAWLTSLVDPEEGVVRIAMFGAMAAFLIAALCVPGAFGDSALIFALAYAGVRIAHIVLFVISSRDDQNLRASVIALAISTAIGVGLLVGASFTDGALTGVLWGIAILLDYGGPFFFGVEGWRMVPSHFAERFGLIVIIALGESIVAIGVGVESEVDAGIVFAAVLGVIVSGALWWLYFDVVALVAERRLSKAAPGRERNSIGRDSYGYLHFPMVAGIVLLALGLKKTLGHVEEPLKLVPAVALLGGTAMYLVAHVAFRLRTVHRLSVQRLGCAVVLLALIPVATELDAVVTLAILATLLVALIVYESIRFAELRDRLRHQVTHEAA
jgi:low temperature requirement protein LtrA